MELNDIKTQTVDLDILNPATGHPTGMVLTLRPKSDPEVKAISERMVEKRRAAERRNKPYTIQQDIADSIRIHAACVVGVKWGEVTLNGKQPKLTPEVAADLLERDFIFEQVSAELQQSADFFTTSGAPSPKL